MKTRRRERRRIGGRGGGRGGEKVLLHSQREMEPRMKDEEWGVVISERTQGLLYYSPPRSLPSYILLYALSFGVLFLVPFSRESRARYRYDDGK